MTTKGGQIDMVFEEFMEYLKLVHGSNVWHWDYGDWYDVITEYNQKAGVKVSLTACHQARERLRAAQECPFLQERVGEGGEVASAVNQ